MSHDSGSGDLAISLAERLKCAAIVTNFSKLIIDPSVSICNSNLIPIQWNSDNIKDELNMISFNKNHRLWDRLSEMYLEY